MRERKCILGEWYVNRPISSISKQQILSVTENIKKHQKVYIIQKKGNKH